MIVLEDTNLESLNDHIIDETFSLVKTSMKHLIGMKGKIHKDVIMNFINNTSIVLQNLITNLS